MSWVAAFAAILGVTLVFAPAASAADTEAIAKSAGQKWVLKSEATGKYVSTEIKGGDNQWAKLRARSDAIGAWERFALHTDDEGKTVSLRFEASGYNGVYDGPDTKDGEKIDYIFSPYTFSTCSVEAYVGLSDHYSIHGSVPLPAK